MKIRVDYIVYVEDECDSSYNKHSSYLVATTLAALYLVPLGVISIYFKLRDCCHPQNAPIFKLGPDESGTTGIWRV